VGAGFNVVLEARRNIDARPATKMVEPQ